MTSDVASVTALVEEEVVLQVAATKVASAPHGLTCAAQVVTEAPSAEGRKLRPYLYQNYPTRGLYA